MKCIDCGQSLGEARPEFPEDASREELLCNACYEHDNAEAVTVLMKFYTDGRVEAGHWQMGLSELQAFVGGLIEYVPSSVPGCALICNEEGTLDNLPLNLASLLYVQPGVNMINGAIQGPVLLVEDHN